MRLESFQGFFVQLLEACETSIKELLALRREIELNNQDPHDFEFVLPTPKVKLFGMYVSFDRKCIKPYTRKIR